MKLTEEYTNALEAVNKDVEAWKNTLISWAETEAFTRRDMD